MAILDEKTIESIALTLRSSLAHIEISGIREWDPVFSNGHGLGDGNTLVVAMRPIDGNALPDAAESIQIWSIIRNGLKDLGYKVGKIEALTKEQKEGFFLVVALETL